MNSYKEITFNIISILRQKYHLGNNCGRSIFDLIEKLEIDGQNPLLFRLPFKNSHLSGFVGYKNERLSVFLNSNRTLGYEIFTAAHEIYHLIENVVMIKESIVIEEDEMQRGEASEKAADIFAAELLIPKSDIVDEYKRQMKLYGLKEPDETVIINLQQSYFVEYKAITKRLAELSLINKNKEALLNEVLCKDNELAKLTLKLGFENRLNEPTKIVLLPRGFMKAVEENYKSGSTSYDELEAIFGYCNLSPEHFGYEEEEITDAALALMKKIKTQLGRESGGKK